MIDQFSTSAFSKGSLGKIMVQAEARTPMCVHMNVSLTREQQDSHHTSSWYHPSKMPGEPLSPSPGSSKKGVPERKRSRELSRQIPR